MTEQMDPRRDAALEWLVRTNDPEFDAWDEFTSWLEEDPANADAYHDLAGAEVDLRNLVPAAPSIADRPAIRVPRRWAIAASVAVLAALGTSIVAPRLSPVEYATRAGETRTIDLGGSDRLVMNGDTVLKVAGWYRRDVRLEAGQIVLRLHDSSKGPIHVRSGDLELVDVGTVFEVTRAQKSTRVTVAEGAVLADPSGAALRLNPGQRLDARDGDQVLRPASADVASVGAFTQGQLVYLDEPLDSVAADLHRSTGIDFSTSPAIRARRFSGTLSIAEVRRDPASLGPILNVSVTRSGSALVLGERN